MTTNIIIWDLDNCLSDDAWRIRLVDWSRAVDGGRYTAYHSACDMDHRAHAAKFATWCRAGFVPWFVTGRPETVRKKTEYWLRYRFGLDSPKLLMRPDDDHRASVDVKCTLLGNALKPGMRIARAYDDREDILQMYRDDFGIDARKLYIHNVDAYQKETAS